MNIEEVRARHESLQEEYRENEEMRLHPSRIGSQFYCEKKVALTEEHGDIETEEKSRGTETHEKAAEDAVEISDDELWEGIESGDQQIIIETGFIADAAEFYLGGIPDAIVFEDRKPHLVFDRKTTARPERLYDNQRIQIWLYGFILDQVGFDTDELKMAILSHTREIDLEVGKELQQRILADYSGWDIGDHRIDEDVVVHVFNFSKIEYLNELNRALEYWRDERDPEPTTNEAKCRSCEYRDVCSASLV